MASGSTAGGFRGFEDEKFDFPETSNIETSTLTTSIQMVKTVALARPFLLAVIGFLLYRLWVVSRAHSAEKKSGVSVLDAGRSSISQDRVSIRKSQRPNMLPPVTMTGKK
jgi:hypothetical protein